MLVYGINPGPSAPNVAAVQYILKPLIDDLIHLYEEGIVIKTNNYPACKTYRSTFYFNSDLFSIGRRVRVAIIAICCDHPAMCRACGFADHNHARAPCPKRKATRNEMQTPEGLQNSMYFFLFRLSSEL